MPAKNFQPLEKHQCKATKVTGDQCQAWAIKGQEVCRIHGGSAPQSKTAAKKRIETAKLEKFLTSLGHRKEGMTPEDLLQEVVERAGADLEYAAFQASTGDPLWVEAYGQILDRAARIAKTGVDAGLAERQTQVQEAQANLLVQVVLGTLQELGLTPQVQAQARKAIATRLREIEG